MNYYSIMYEPEKHAIFSEVITEMRHEYPTLTGRTLVVRRFPNPDYHIVKVEITDTRGWRQIMFHPRLWGMLEMDDRLTLAVPGWEWERRGFPQSGNYTRGVALPHTILKGGAMHRSQTKGAEADMDSVWKIPRLNEQGRDIFAKLGLDDYRLGSKLEPHERPTKSGIAIMGTRYINRIYALFNDVEAYALAKLRF